MEIRHLIFCVHPCLYEALPPERIHHLDYAQCLEREQEVKQRWLAVLARRQQGTLYLQVGGPPYLLDTAKEQLGEPYACSVPSPPPAKLRMQPRDWLAYYAVQTQTILDHIKSRGLQFDPATTTSELWGESFEGCVCGYGGALAHLLGLKRPPRMEFEMTVFDSRFLYGAKRWECIALPDTDVEAWLFECYDGTGAAIFQARLTPQWLDKRPILMRADPTRLLVCTKTGFTVWPERPPAKGDPDEPRPFIVTTSDEYWVRSTRMNVDELRAVVASAVVC
jgi:hypothetical protein